MIHHYLTKYKENGKRYAEAWLQINLFGNCYCFSKRRIELKADTGKYDGEIKIKTRVDNSELNKTMKKLKKASALADELAKKRIIRI